jgi:hypothetical protein
VRTSLPLLTASTSRFSSLLLRGTLAPVGSGLSFSCSRHQGALFIPQAETHGMDLVDPDSLRQYIAENFDHWCAFVRQKRYSPKVCQGALTLVYGCDKGSAWTTAVFTSKSSGGSVTFSGGLVPGLAPTVQVEGSWSAGTRSPVEWRSGPHSPSKPPRLSPEISTQGFPDACAYTFFIRAFRIKKGLTRFNAPKVMAAAAGPHNSGGPHHDSEDLIAVLAGPVSASSPSEPVVDETSIVSPIALTRVSDCSIHRISRANCVIGVRLCQHRGWSRRRSCTSSCFASTAEGMLTISPERSPIGSCA